MSNGTATWIGGNGDWNTSGDWNGTLSYTLSNGVPGYDDVLINNGFTVTVAATDTLANNYASVTVGGGTSLSTLQVNGNLSNTGPISVLAKGALNVGSTGVLGDTGTLSIAANGSATITGIASISSTFTVSGSFILNGTNPGGGNMNLTLGGGLEVKSGGSAEFTGTSTTHVGGGALTVDTGASLDIASGSTIYGFNGLMANGTVTIEGAYIPSNGAIGGSGSLIVNGGSIGSSSYFTTSNAGLTVTLKNGAQFYSNGQPGATINFSSNSTGSPNSLVINDYQTNFTTPITNFGAGDQISFLGNSTNVSAPTVTSNGNGTYSVALTGSVVTLTDVTFTPAITAQITTNSNGTVNVPGITDSNSPTDQLGECFLPGTAIATPSGSVLVEALQAGDLVTTIVAGEYVTKPVKWIGYRDVKAGDLVGDSAHPIRIKANAFAEGVPMRDLLITSEHCIFAHGGLIPARLLVNGRSIISDSSISNFTYYHVELEDHAILLAEGLAVESYLDTGNRGNFANAPVPSLRACLTIRIPAPHEAQPAAPILVQPNDVKPVWEALDERATMLGLQRHNAQPTLTYDADLHLVTGTGAVIRPLRLTAGKAWFVLPEESGSVSLVSRTARPCDTIAAYIDDRRALGVSVGEITVHVGSNAIVVTSHLTSSGLAGWHAPEGASHRWTRGRGELELPKLPAITPAILEIEILQAGPYIAESVPERAIAA